MQRGKVILTGALLCLLVVMIFVRSAKEDETDPTAGETSQGVQATSGDIQTASAVKQLGNVVKDEASGGIIIAVEDENGEEKEYLFEDVSSDAWYVPALNYAVSSGLMSNVVLDTGESFFCPDYGITRSQFAMILYRFADAEPVEAQHIYEDVPSYEWYYDCVNWADSQGLITGIDESTFGVNEYLTCEQVVIILHRMAGTPKSSAALDEYPYLPKVSDYGKEAVRWAWETGLIAEDECVWYPTQSISRAQTAFLLMRYYELVEEGTIA